MIATACDNGVVYCFSNVTSSPHRFCLRGIRARSYVILAQMSVAHIDELPWCSLVGGANQWRRVGAGDSCPRAQG